MSRWSRGTEGNLTFLRFKIENPILHHEFGHAPWPLNALPALSVSEDEKSHAQTKKEENGKKDHRTNIIATNFV